MGGGVTRRQGAAFRSCVRDQGFSVFFVVQSFPEHNHKTHKKHRKNTEYAEKHRKETRLIRLAAKM